jgi:eukaryotic-like serine/threonine-protein kinase
MSDARPLVDLQHLAAGEGWVLSRGRDPALGSTRLLVTLAGAALVELRRRLAVMSSVGGGHLAEVLDAVAMTGSVGVVVAAPGGPSLAELVDRRGLLSAGEVTTLVVPLAAVLGDLQARGLSLSAVEPATVWLAADGRPVLLPVGCVDGPGGCADLASTALAVLDRSSPGAASVAEVLEAARARQLDAVGLAAAISRAVPAVPIAVVAPPVAERGRGRRRAEPSRPRRAEPRRPGRPRRAEPGRPRRPRRPMAWLRGARPAVSVIAVGAVAIALGGWWGRHDASGAVVASPTRAAPTASSSPGVAWLAVMTRLEQARAEAFASGDVRRLDAVYATGSPTGAADRRLLGRMVRHGEHAVGLQAFVESVDVVAATDVRATLRVSDALTAYDVVAADGHVLRRGHGRPTRRWTMTVVAAPGGWRVWSVRRVAAGVP